MPTARRPVGMRSVVTAVVLITVAGCAPGTSPAPSSPNDRSSNDRGTLAIQVVAGPVCPVERDPPDPACAPRPVAGARIFVQPGDGRDIVVADAITDAAGLAAIDLPVGDYVVIGADVEGLMGRPDPADVTIAAGERTTATLAYDTGIR